MISYIYFDTPQQTFVIDDGPMDHLLEKALMHRSHPNTEFNKIVLSIVFQIQK